MRAPRIQRIVMDRTYNVHAKHLCLPPRISVYTLNVADLKGH